jgi:SAM-dependent methyltransferase
MKSALSLRHYPEMRFGGYADIDGTVTFYTRVNSLLKPTSIVADIGCGRGIYLQDAVDVRRKLRILKGRCARVIGIDIDEAGVTNEAIDEFRLIEGRWPLEDSSIDLCLADNVVEHLDASEPFFSEMARVVRPGGYIAIRTVNLWSYVGIASKAIPERLHMAVLLRIQMGKKPQDSFPTRYRCNTRRRLTNLLERHGLDTCVYTYEAEPSYLDFSRLLYSAGVLHQRYAPKSFRVSLFAFAQRPPI